MWLSSCGCSLSAENTERWVQWEGDQWAAEGEVKLVKDAWRRREWWPAFLSRRRWEGVWCMQGKWELVFSYADELLLFAVCLFRGICAPGLKIKALMVCNSRSGSHVGGSLLSQHVFFMKERWFMSIVRGEHSCLWGTVSMTCAISILERQG